MKDMKEFGTLRNRDLRDIWKHETYDFTKWLADNISDLGDALGMELELAPLENREVSVGDFSLDLLAKDLGSSDQVVIENQLTQTDHDHLGKLLTYASGIGASVVIWIAESIREEHRQALEWLNQRTDSDTRFFGVVIEVLQIDDSKPAYNFKIIVSPNEWQKEKRHRAIGAISAKQEKYQNFFQSLIDDLRKRKFTGAKRGQPQNWYSFSSGSTGISFSCIFASDNCIRVQVYINRGDQDKNKELFNELKKQKEAIEKELGSKLEWECRDDKKSSRIEIYTKGSIESPDDELEKVRSWMINNLLAFKRVFKPKIADILNQTGM